MASLTYNEQIELARVITAKIMERKSVLHQMSGDQITQLIMAGVREATGAPSDPRMTEAKIKEGITGILRQSEADAYRKHIVGKFTEQGLDLPEATELMRLLLATNSGYPHKMVKNDPGFRAGTEAAKRFLAKYRQDPRSARLALNGSMTMQELMRKIDA